MAEPLKQIYNRDFLSGLGTKIAQVYKPFDRERFIASVMDETWESLELKGRIRKIAIELGKTLPSDYPAAIGVLLEVNASCSGFPYLIFPDFVEVHGQQEKHWDVSMAALEQFTQTSSAEFAVRPFLLNHPQRMMEQMESWSRHANEHVRRLSSEGCRPRLPWGQALTMFKKDPLPIMPILEQLKEDPSLYVRKSVANNLNDIAKDHPDLVLNTAKRWIGRHPHTDWIIRHGCRGLIRKGLPEVLEVFGYASDAESTLVQQAEVSIHPAALRIGEGSTLSYELRVREGESLHIRVEYGIDFVKSGGKRSRKQFLLSDKTIPGGSRITGTRQHAWANLTTRRHYPGEHHIVLLVNGREVAETSLELLAPGEES